MRSKSREAKREYLLGKMLEGARALYDFFETLRNEKDTNPKELASRINTKYNLTKNQAAYLDNVAERTTKAKTIVQYLEKRFGVKKDGTFKDPKGLYSLLFREKPIQRIEARTYNLGIGFTYGSWNYKGFRGFKHNCEGIDYHPLYDDIQSTISRLETGIGSGCKHLTFRMPVDSKLKKFAEEENRHSDRNLSEEERTLRLIFGRVSTPEKIKQELVNHELRHVIDSIIGNDLEFFTETPAHLYAESTEDRVFWGLKRDFDNAGSTLKNRIKNIRKRTEKLKESNAPDVIISTNEKRLMAAQRELEDIEQKRTEQYELYKQFVRGALPEGCLFSGRMSDVSDGAMSYLFSTMPRNKVFKRIKDIMLAQTKEADLE